MVNGAAALAATDPAEAWAPALGPVEARALALGQAAVWAWALGPVEGRSWALGQAVVWAWGQASDPG